MVAAPTLVVFRRHKETRQLVALLPQVRLGYGLCQSITAGGQVGVADWQQMLRDTTAASALLSAEVRALLAELVSTPLSYRVQVVAAEAVPVERAGLGQQVALFAEASTRLVAA